MTDVDECSSEEHPCDYNANCTNSDGSFSCTCQLGYTGNGLTCEGKGYTTFQLNVHAYNIVRQFYICLQISMSVTWIMNVMKRMECVLTLMELISVAVKWGSDLMETDSTVVVSQFVGIFTLDVEYICRQN